MYCVFFIIIIQPSVNKHVLKNQNVSLFSGVLCDVVPLELHTAAYSIPGLEKLTRRHAIKVCPVDGVMVEECSLAVGEAVGYGSVKFASRMNRAVVIFLDSMETVHQPIESGVVIHATLSPVLSLVNPAKKVHL